MNYLDEQDAKIDTHRCKDVPNSLIMMDLILEMLILTLITLFKWIDLLSIFDIIKFEEVL